MSIAMRINNTGNKINLTIKKEKQLVIFPKQPWSALKSVKYH